MTDLDYLQVKEIFLAACEIPDERRSAFLDAQCSDNNALRAEVERIFKADESAEQLEAMLDLTLTLSGASFVLPEDAPIPDQIGAYRIIGRLGHGGMGVVYEALQRRPKRRVALKVIQSALATPQAVARFEQEVELLGRLRHPQMAQIYDAGVHELSEDESKSKSLPYFAMELINGKPITDYAQQHALGTEAILGLMLRLCDAVTYAHRKGVIHLDLKPANILIDHAGHPKILDFGIARALDHTQVPDQKQSKPRFIQGTIPYMSPEQMDRRLDRVDERADVHALGMITYELLARSLPWALDDLTLFEAIDTMRTVAPRPLRKARREFPADLDFVLNRAIARDHEDRYDSPGALAEDLTRFLERRPIPGRSSSALHRTGLFMARHRALSIAIAIGAVLCMLLATALWRANARIDELEQRLQQTAPGTIGLHSGNPGHGR